MGSGIDGGGSARRNAYEKVVKTCACGRVLRGNAGIASHQKACEANLTRDGWPLEKSMQTAIRDEYRHTATHTILSVRRGLGQAYLERRRAGDKTELRWAEYRDLVWELAEAAQPQLTAAEVK